MNLLTYKLLGLKPKIFGLEIENCSIKAVWMEKKQGIFKMTSCGRKILPRGIVQEGRIMDSKKLASEINELLATAQPKPIKIKDVIFSIPETKAFIRTILIPKMSAGEIREAVKWETEANIPISLERAYLDWQIINTKGNMDEILVIAVPKNIVDSYCEAVKLAGLVPLAVEIDIVATARSLTDPQKRNQTVLIADIGTENTSLAICQNQIPYFTSSIPFSGNTFTEFIQKEMGVSWEKAEEIKFSFGLGEEAGEDILYKIFDPLIENLASEIIKSINFFEESINKLNKVEKIILAGGGALLMGIENHLSRRLGKKVELGNPLNQINIEDFPFKISARDLLSYSTAIGLALRVSDDEY